VAIQEQHRASHRPGCGRFHLGLRCRTTNDDGTRDSLHISSNDVAGVALVAIKELYQQNRELVKQNAELSNHSKSWIRK